MVFTISIDCSDNAGKTDQIALLPLHSSVKHIGPLHEYDEKLDKLVKEDKLTSWWWSCSDEEVVKTIVCALEKRQAVTTAITDCKLVIVDRGTALYGAVAISRIAVKNGWEDLD